MADQKYALLVDYTYYSGNHAAEIGCKEELGREATNMLLEKVVDSEIYQPMIDREMLTYEVFNKGGKHEIACLYVTLKGMRYCIMFGDEISSRRPVDPAGVPRK